MKIRHISASTASSALEKQVVSYRATLVTKAAALRDEIAKANAMIATTLAGSQAATNLAAQNASLTKQLSEVLQTMKATE